MYGNIVYNRNKQPKRSMAFRKVVAMWYVASKEDSLELDAMIHSTDEGDLRVMELMLKEIPRLDSKTAYEYLKCNIEKAKVLKGLMEVLEDDIENGKLAEGIGAGVKDLLGQVKNTLIDDPIVYNSITMDDRVNDILIKLILLKCSNGVDSKISNYVLERAKIYIQSSKLGRLLDATILNRITSKNALLMNLINFKCELIKSNTHMRNCKSDIQLAKIICKGEKVESISNRLQKLALVGGGLNAGDYEIKEVLKLLLLVCIEIAERHTFEHSKIDIDKISVAPSHPEWPEWLERDTKFKNLNAAEKNLILCRVRILSKLYTCWDTDALNNVIFDSREYEKAYEAGLKKQQIEKSVNND